MTARARLYIAPVLNVEGQPATGAAIQIREPDGTTPLVQPLYASRDGLIPLGTTTLSADARGRILAWAAWPQDVCAVPVSGEPWIASIERTPEDRLAIEGLETFHAEHYRQVGDVSDWECIQRAVDAAAARYLVTGSRCIAQLASTVYTIHRSVRMRGLSGVWLRGDGMDLTTIDCTTDINGGDLGVAEDDPQQSDLIDAANGALTPDQFPRDLTWSDMTLDGTNMSLEGLTHAWQEVGKASALIEAQNVHRPQAFRIRCVNGNANGIVFGNSTPNFANAFEDGRIEECEFLNTPRGLGLHYKYAVGGGHAPYGIAAQMGVMNGGRFASNRIIAPNGPAYAVVGSRGLILRDNLITGYGGEVAAVNGSIGGLHVDFGAFDCLFDANVAIDGGPWIVNGQMTPSVYNGGVSIPGARGSSWTNNKSVGTARAPYPAPPTLTNGGYHLNTSGQDAFLILAGAATFTDIRVGLRADQALPVGTRLLVVPNGWRVYLAWDPGAGTPTATWWLARTAASAPTFPASGGSVTNGTSLPQILDIAPQLTSTDLGPIPVTSLPATTGFSARVGGVERPRTGQRVRQLALAAGEALTLTYNNAAVAAALEASYNVWGYHGLSVTGWGWTWHNTVQWTPHPSVPDSGLDLGRLAYNPLGVTCLAEVLSGSFSQIRVQNALGAVTQNQAIISGETGRVQFLVDPGGAFEGVWSGTRPTWRWWAAPNALLPQFYVAAGSVTGYQGNVEHCRFVGNTIRLAPSGGVLLVDGKGCVLSNDMVNIGDGRPAASYAFWDSGVTGGGTRDCTIDGGTLDDTRSIVVTSTHYTDNGPNNTGNRITDVYLGPTTGLAVSPSGGSAARVDATGCRGPSIPLAPLTPPPAPASGAAQTNPFSFVCQVYLNVSGNVSSLILDGVEIGKQTAFRLRVGGTYTATYTGTLTTAWVGAN